jgi:hypothetical protein
MCLLDLLGETGCAAHIKEEHFPLSVHVFQYRNYYTISIKFGIEPKLCISVQHTALLCTIVTLHTGFYVIYLLCVRKLYFVPKYVVVIKST